ncbi:MAG: DNA-directed RNA polymerase subunit beta' [Candidatus Marinimicrobia bacterium]|nr:DNA-directed RNA polymerase subunit beta' [Candidatus Neomarinimicrobiota bacterium]|tara:strand:+ start:4049 stop:8317 length:4269 start_codon:yes stop_codon:yes gene_type:complete
MYKIKAKGSNARKSNSFSRITLGLLSPEEILARSNGEILKPETINYRSYKPEKDGLFCEKIFGPVKDWECNCGKYRGIRYRNIVCDRCGVEVTRKTVRRERTGHITLAVPVVHLWYLRSIPSKISNLLGYTTKQVESITYYEKYVVLNSGKSSLKYGDLIDEDEYLDLQDEFGIETASDKDIEDDNYFVALMGGNAIKELLANIDVVSTIKELHEILNNDKTSNQKKEDVLKRLRILRKFDPRKEKFVYNKPEWMILSILPVIPPELRPLVPLDGGRFAASDLNDLYRRVIIRNNRLKQLIEIKAPDVILRNEKRMLQESVDSLLDNSRYQSAVRSGTRRPLKSLSDSLKGKTGRFRQNLLGKRVDYSARSVIVVGPELNLHECGLPKEMAMELYKPIVLSELIKRNYANTPKSAKMLIDQKDSSVYKVLEYVVSDHPVLLNRAPTLHRLGIQAFQPKLIDGKAIRLHPLVCSAFNADFDGDQMAVHVPLSSEAKMEAWFLMLSSHNILHPATGNPIAIPSQDMILGCYYLTRSRKGELGEKSVISSFDEARLAYANKEISLHAIVSFRPNDETLIENTTVGRIIFNDILPKGIEYINQRLGKKDLLKLVYKCYTDAGNYETVLFLDRLKDLGFYYAFQSGLSIAIDDIIIPKEKDGIINKAAAKVDSVQDNFDKKVITEGERYNKVIDVWTHATTDVANEMFKELKNDNKGFNALYMMADSGARGSQDQIKQLAGMRGLMAKPKKTMSGSSGEIIENPIVSNFKEGLSVFEYFISTHGARKGLADTALKTADAGYLTRRLVDVAQDLTISEDDCGTIQGVLLKDLKEGEEIIEPLSERIIGRYSAEDVIDSITGEVIVKANTLMDDKIVSKIVKASVFQVKARSVLTCESANGLCRMCYGLNLATNKHPELGDAIGIMAAQSIGEPGTQLTLRTFHIGGTATRMIEQSSRQSNSDGVVKYSKALQTLSTKDEQTGLKNQVCVVRNGEIELIKNKNVISSWKVPYGAKLHVKDGAKVKAHDMLFSWDPYTDVILARSSGVIRYKDMIDGETYVEEAIDDGKKMVVITESKNRNLSPHIEIESAKGESIIGGVSILPIKATVLVKEGQKVSAGEVMVKIPKDMGKTMDITGGLPRIAELFEARNPWNPAVITEIDGRVKYGKIKRGIREIHVMGSDLEKVYKIPYGKHVLVHDNDFITAGDKLCEGSVSPKDILAIKGSAKVQEYLVDAIQQVYRIQGVSINDKHIEVIVRQMMLKVLISEPGDSQFYKGDRVSRLVLKNENIDLSNKRVVKDPGDSDYDKGDIAYFDNIKELNVELKENGKNTIKVRKCVPATYTPLLLGITRASLNTESFISAASFQETTRVLTDAAVEGKTDFLRGLKENVIIGRLIPAGTGNESNRKITVSPKKKSDTVDSVEEAPKIG